MKYYIAKFTGTFGFIKPFSANRDNKTKSLNYITPSMLMGIERLLFGESIADAPRIIRHRLKFSNIQYLTETTESINYERKRAIKCYKPSTSTITRGVLINPELFLVFDNLDDAEFAVSQHVCLGRNEDIMFGADLITVNSLDEFNETFKGYESFKSDENSPNSIYAGYNKYTQDKQYVTVEYYGNFDDFLESNE